MDTLFWMESALTIVLLCQEKRAKGRTSGLKNTEERHKSRCAVVERTGKRRHVLHRQTEQPGAVTFKTVTVGRC